MGAAVWVKICGIRDEQSAEHLCRLGPDAIGLNFYSKSPRSVSREEAVRISRTVNGRLHCVGVFVNQTATEIEDLAADCRLDAIQLHGDETVRQIVAIFERMKGIRIFRAWRMAGETLHDLAEHLAECQSSGVEFAGCLIDSRVTGAYGGTGQTVPWTALAAEYEHDVWPPLVLAGGLNPNNVVDAIQTVRPWGVDVASGVESAPGIKDLDQVQRFIENARRA